METASKERSGTGIGRRPFYGENRGRSDRISKTELDGWTGEDHKGERRDKKGPEKGRRKPLTEF